MLSESEERLQQVGVYRLPNPSTTKDPFQT